MKLSRTQDHLCLSLTQFEYETFFRKSRSPDGRLRCYAVLHPTEDTVRFKFGPTGRAFSLTSSGEAWRVALDIVPCRAQNLPIFGLTPTAFATVSQDEIDVQVPELRNPIKRYTRKAPPFASKDYHVQPRHQEEILVLENDSPPARYVTDAEMRAAREIFNRAIDRGFIAKFDAKGHILWFERKVGA